MKPFLLFLVAAGACGTPAKEQPAAPRPDWRAAIADRVDPAVLAVKDREILHAPENRERRAFFPKDDPHGNRNVRMALDDPLGISARETEIARRHLSRQPIPHSESSYRAERIPGLEPLGDEAADAISALYAFLVTAQDAWEEALADLNREEREFLRQHLPRFLTRSTQQDKDRALKGIEDVDARRSMMRCAALWEKVDMAAADKARAMVEIAIATVLPKLLEYGLHGVFRKNELRLDLEGGPVVVRGINNGGGPVDALLLIDLGGNDEHQVPDDAPWRPIRVFIDLDGDDLYLSNAPHAWGGALLGISMHIDVAGNDDYRAGDWGLGCGLGGYGILRDFEGRDRYYGGLGVAGVGIFGMGELVDFAGNDEYAGGLFCQGFASTGGHGTLIDHAGDDTYLAGRDDEDIWRRKATYITFAQGSAYGHRFGHIWTDEQKKRRWKMTGQLPGGVGRLIDGGGNDTYQADVFGQGSAYWYSLGVLYDGGGNDHYRATWYGQGVGTHAAAGIVIDAAGDDVYLSRNTSQGCGHDFSIGILHDLRGNDTYRGTQLCQGAGNALSSLGLLVDEAGDDDYHCFGRCWGFGAPEKKKPEHAPYGFLLDFGGVDGFHPPQQKPWEDGAGRFRQGKRGFGLDR